MQSAESKEIIARFFGAIDVLIDVGAMRGKKTFTDIVECDRRNYYRMEHNHDSDIFQVAWLKVLVEKYRISAEWLLTGHGSMFR